MQLLAARECGLYSYGDQEVGCKIEGLYMVASTEKRKLASATVKHIRIAPSKARLIANLIRGKQVEPALQLLRFSPRKGAAIALKVLRSAISNAKEKGVELDGLWVTGARVDGGRTIKRGITRAKGQMFMIRMRSSHFTIELGNR